MSNLVFNDRPISFLMRQTVFVLILMITTMSSFSQSFANSVREEIEAIEKWSGKIAFEELIAKAPVKKTVVDQATWETLWRAWRPTEAVPVIDFSKNIILVETAKDSSNILTSSLNLTPSGELRYEVGTTKKAGPGFGYLFLTIPKKGIVSINGKLLFTVPVMPKSDLSATPKTPRKPGYIPTPAEIDAAIAQATTKRAKTKRVKPQNQPAQAQPNQPALAQQNQPAAQTPTPQIGTDNQQSINVDIIGAVRTGMIIHGSQSKSAMVVSNGIIWKLDFQNNPTLIRSAQQLGANLGRITGTLTMRPDPIRKTGKLVVLVQSIAPWSESSMPNSNNPLASTIPAQPNQLGSNTIPQAPFPPTQIQPTQIQPTQVQPNLPGAGNANSPTVNRQPSTRQVNSFRSITVSITGGKSPAERRKSVTSSGLVKIEVPQSRYLDEFKLDPAMLDQLHRFVEQTNWNSIPPSSRTSGADKNVTNYSISIETVQGTKRFFMDGPAAAAEPVVTNLFKLMQRPK